MTEEEVEGYNPVLLPESIRRRWKEVVGIGARLEDWFMGYTNAWIVVRNNDELPMDPPRIVKHAHELPAFWTEDHMQSTGIMLYQVGTFDLYECPKDHPSIQYPNLGNNERVTDPDENGMVIVVTMI